MEKTEQKLSLGEAFRITRRGVALWRKSAPGLFTAMTASAVVTAAAPYVPLWFTARLLEEISGARDPQRLTVLAVLLLTAGTAALLASAACQRWKQSKSATRYSDEYEMIFTKLLDLDFCLVDDQKTYERLSQVNQNRNFGDWGLQRLLENYDKLLGGVIKVVCAVALSVGLFLLPVPAGEPLAWLNSPLCVVVMMAALVGASVLSPWLYTKGNACWAQAAEYVKQGNRSFSYFTFIGMKERERAQDIRLYGQDDFFRHGAENCDGMLFEDCPVAKQARGPMGLLVASAEAVTRVMTGLVYLFVCLKALGGAFGVGLVSQYIGAVTSLAGGVSDCIRTAGDLRNNAPFLSQVLELLDMKNVMYQGSLTTEKRADRQYEIEFRDVSFRYPGAATDSLSHVSMKFKVGQRLAVVGENGSGKTTFIKLLCRLYDPTEGQILLNGIDIRKYRYDDYLAVFSVVFQDFQLLALPLGQNVAASVHLDRQRAEQCLRAAGFGDRLDALPEGLDTYLYKDYADTGVEVSGGEAQKIALARTLYKDAPFIILDEPTAALDPVAEAEIYQRFNDIVGNKTAIYISHRLSSCKFCDEIAVFDQGQVVQQGTHQELVACAGGKYEALWNAQAQYYTENKE